MKELKKYMYSDSKQNIRIGIKKYAIRADIELILNTFAMKTHINRATIPMYRFSDKTTPNPVATPLPPLKFNQSGKQCPKTVDIATMH